MDFLNEFEVEVEETADSEEVALTKTKYNERRRKHRRGRRR